MSERTPRPQTFDRATIMLNGRPVLRGAGVDFAVIDDSARLPDALTRAELMSGSWRSGPDDVAMVREFAARAALLSDAWPVRLRRPLRLWGWLALECDRRRFTLGVTGARAALPDARPCRACGFGACLFLCANCAAALSDPARRPRVLDRLRARMVKERTAPLPLP